MPLTSPPHDQRCVADIKRLKAALQREEDEQRELLGTLNQLQRDRDWLEEEVRRGVDALSVIGQSLCR